MADVRFTRRCFEEDLQRIPRWAQKEAIRAAEIIVRSPEVGLQLEPPMERFRRMRIRTHYRLIYTYDFETDIWWIYLVGERRPGKERDVHEQLRRLMNEGATLR